MPLKQQADLEEEWEPRFGPDNRIHGTKMARPIKEFISTAKIQDVIL
jgi:hypothetical protein